MVRLQPRSFTVVLIMAAAASIAAAQTNNKVSAVGGTLVVAVPVPQGIVVCSDKRLYNETTGTFRDDFTKIHKVNDKALFVATHTTGFLNQTSGKMAFDIFDLTQNYVSHHPFTPSTEFWNGFRNEMRSNLLAYLSKLKFTDLPETDLANNRLLFNLVFFTIESSAAKSYSISVFYEKAKTPVVDVSGVTSEIVRTPKLLGKGKDVMALFAQKPELARDPSILKFDQSYFSIERTTPRDAVTFASRLFSITNANLPQARVSATHDCALLGYQSGFNWIDDFGSITNAQL